MEKEAAQMLGSLLPPPEGVEVHSTQEILFSRQNARLLAKFCRCYVHRINYIEYRHAAQ